MVGHGNTEAERERNIYTGNYTSEFLRQRSGGKPCPEFQAAPNWRPLTRSTEFFTRLNPTLFDWGGESEPARRAKFTKFRIAATWWRRSTTNRPRRRGPRN